MTNQEIKTITEAMSLIQQWVRETTSEFLKVWAKNTEDKLENYRYCVLLRNRDKCDIDMAYYIDRGYSGIYSVSGNNELGENEQTIDLQEVDIELLEKITHNLNKKLKTYFKKIQADIDNLSKKGTAINNIIEKLK